VTEVAEVVELIKVVVAVKQQEVRDEAENGNF